MEDYTFVVVPQDPETFWDKNKELLLFTEFKDFSEEENSSRIMCAIALLYDTRARAYNSGMSEEKKVSEICKNFLGDKRFPLKKKYQHIIDAYKEHTYTTMEKEVDYFEKLL